MKSERQIRFLYPPFILIGSLFLGIYYDQSVTLDSIVRVPDDIDFKGLITALIGGGALVLVTGYIIGTITITILRIISLGKYETEGIRNFEIISKTILKKRYKSEIEHESDSNKLYALATFDHEFLPENIHEWIQRRWTSFHTSANVAISLFLSLIIGCKIGIHISCGWLTTVSLLIAMYAYHSWKARKETIGMIDFQTKVKRNKTKIDDYFLIKSAPNEEN